MNTISRLTILSVIHATDASNAAWICELSMEAEMTWLPVDYEFGTRA